MIFYNVNTKYFLNFIYDVFWQGNSGTVLNTSNSYQSSKNKKLKFFIIEILSPYECEKNEKICNYTD